MAGLSDLRMFAEIARSPSLAHAAARLGMAPATISGRLKAMEAHYGVSLVRRSTRSLALTDEGMMLRDRAQALVQDFDALDRSLRGRTRVEAGPLVISAPGAFGLVAAGLVARFAARHPGVAIRLETLTEEAPFDVGFRIGALRCCSLTTRKVAEMGWMTCAAPAYLERRLHPSAPSALVGHDCIMTSHEGSRWRYAGTDVVVSGSLTLDDPSLALGLCLAGRGVARLTDRAAAGALASGALVQVLAGFELAPLPVHMLSGPRKLLPLRTLRFLDFAMAELRQTPPALCA